MLILLQIYGDRLTLSGVHKAIHAHSRVAPTYGYIFGYKGKYSLGRVVGRDAKNWGVGCGEGIVCKIVRIYTNSYESYANLKTFIHFFATDLQTFSTTSIVPRTNPDLKKQTSKSYQCQM